MTLETSKPIEPSSDDAEFFAQLNNPLRRLWAWGKITFIRLNRWRGAGDLTSTIIPATGWSAIYKTADSFLIQPLVCFEVFKEGETVRAFGLKLALVDKHTISYATRMGVMPYFHNSILEDAEDCDDFFIGYLAPSQTLEEWVAIARSNGIKYEFTDVEQP